MIVQCWRDGMLLALEFNHDFHVYHPTFETLSFRRTFRSLAEVISLFKLGEKRFYCLYLTTVLFQDQRMVAEK